MDSETQLPIPFIWYRFEENVSIINNYGTTGQDHDARLHEGASAGPNINPIGTASLSLRKNQDNSGQYLTIPPFSFVYPITISFWFKKESKGQYFTDIIDFSNTNNSDSQFLLAFTKKGNLWIFYDQKLYNISDTNYCDNKWHHIVIAVDQSNVNIFIDTDFIKRLPSFSFKNAYRNMNYIGSSYRGDDDSTINIADFRIYTVALTANDVLFLFNYYKLLYISNTVSENDTSNTLNNRMKIFNELHMKAQSNSVLHYFIIVGLPVVLFIIIALILYLG